MGKFFIILGIFLSMLYLNAYEFKGIDRLVVVITKDWNTSKGTLYCLEQQGNIWKIQQLWDVVIGRNGLAWGIGLFPKVATENGKREGDGKSPAGMFLVRKILYGYDIKPNFPLSWKYIQTTKEWVGVDDSKSIYYNQIVNKKEVKTIDWKSYEHMKRKDHLYKWVLMVEHNTTPPKAMMGSCIFLHLWRGAQSSTAGCTAMSESNLLKLIQWASTGKNVALLQLPKSEYDTIKDMPKLNKSTKK